MDEKEVEKLKEDLTRWPKAVTKQLSNHTEMFGQILKNEIMIVKLICQLHEIDGSEIIEKLRLLESKAKRDE